MNVLVIDDSLSACRSVGRILMDQATTHCCINGSDWLSHYNIEKPDVVLLDIMMPIIDGTDILRQIREVDKDIPVIMVSAIDDADKILECIKLGADGYVTKPISADKITKSVKTASRINAINSMAMNTAVILERMKEAR